MQGPYAFINERPQPYPLLKLDLSLNPHIQTKFDILNQHIRNVVVLPGQLVIIPDARTASCTTLGALAGTGVCAIVFGIPTLGAGALACAIVGGAAGGFAGSKVGSKIGEGTGKLLYSTVSD